MTSLDRFKGDRSAGNVAPEASSIFVSSQAGNQTCDKAVDGFIDGWPNDFSREWSTNAEDDGAWIELSWAIPQTIDHVILYDRINLNDQILSGTLSFSDGSTILFGLLDNTGAGDDIFFTARTVTSVRMTVDATSVSTGNIGLAKIEVYTVAE